MNFFINALSNLSSWMPTSVIGLTTAIGAANYYYYLVVKKPKVYCKEGRFKTFIYQNMPVINKKYWPTFWCYEARLQSIVSGYIRSLTVPKIPFKRELLNLHDGGQVAIDWLEPAKNANNNHFTILFLPGLTGDSDCEYVKAVSLSIHKAGFRLVVFNYRGIGGIQLKTPRSYSANNIEDLLEVIIHIKHKYPNTVLGGLGISMGGLILGNFLQSKEQHTYKHFMAAMIVSVPWNLNSTVKNIEKPIINYLITNYLANCLKKQIRDNRGILDSSNYKWNYDEIMKSKTIREFDRNFTIKMFGYNTVEEYYDAASLHDKIDRFQTPCLFLSAEDDPFALKQDIPTSLASSLENVAILVTARGGHIGFLEGSWPFSNKSEFMMHTINQYFNAIFNDNNYNKFI
ncbi:phospholipase ABHD3 [Daktulosphaira vitifoliae]|uniref:phospholipase ABHD3 n=1 Tax=Daktulosphaira vitifoliae TaxID=58002 RepID=UPI0021AA164B|nr:phospholipase ABHD3 [Daktulosphaira vitifoliae]